MVKCLNIGKNISKPIYRSISTALSKETASIDLSTTLSLAVTPGGKPPIRSTQHMSCWAVQSGLRIDSLFPVSFALPKEAVMLDDLASGVPFALGGGWVLGITGVWLEPELQPKAANPLSVLILFLSASSPYHHAALSGLRGQLREESHVTPHQPRTKQNLQALNTNPSSPWRVIYRRLSHFAGQRLALTQASLWTPLSAGLSWSATVIRIMYFICCCTCHQSVSLSFWDPANQFCPLSWTYLFI